MEKTIKVKLEYGLHARPSAFIVAKLSKMNLTEAILIHKECEISLKSVLSLIAECIETDDEVIVKISGPDEIEAMKIVEDTLESTNKKDVFGIEPYESKEKKK